MNSTANVLAAMNTMQSNIQNTLPVIPNNGNPAGAYNMPLRANGMGAAIPDAPPVANDMPVQKADPWPWLQPSPFMSMLAEDLKTRSARLQEQLGQMNSYMPQAPEAAPAVTPMPAQTPVMGLSQAVSQVPPAMAMPVTTQAPVLPMPGNGVTTRQF